MPAALCVRCHLWSSLSLCLCKVSFALLVESSRRQSTALSDVVRRLSRRLLVVVIVDPVCVQWLLCDWDGDEDAHLLPRSLSARP